MKKRVLIIGGTSFLGQAVANVLADSYQVDSYSRTNPSFNFQDSFVSELDDFELSKTLEYDLVINALAAGSQSSRWNDINAEEHFYVNTYFPIKLVLFLERNQFKGSVCTFGSYFEMGVSQEDRGLTEKDILSSTAQTANPYILSKRMLSQYFKMARLNLHYHHFILPTIYGEEENKERLIPTIVRSLRSGEELKLTEGNQVRQYLYAGDIADLMVGCIGAKRSLSGIYNVPGSEKKSVKEIFAEISTILNTHTESPFGKIKREDESMKYLCLVSNEIEQKFGWKAKTTIQEVVKNYA